MLNSLRPGSGNKRNLWLTYTLIVAIGLTGGVLLWGL